MSREMHNFTLVITFSFMGFSDFLVIQILHVVLYVIMYLLVLVGNLLIITLMSKDPWLKTPMYYFLKNLSFLDLCFISITVSKSNSNSMTNQNTISFLGCVSQVLFIILLASAEVAFLTVMSYDRYVAICHPLQYEIIMNHGACGQMAASSWVSECLSVILHTAATFSVPTYGSPDVHQYFRKVPQLLSLACSCNIAEFLAIGITFLLEIIYMGFINISYINIFSTVLGLPSKEGRSKAFSTCLSHLTVVAVFFSSGAFDYSHLLPKSPSPMDLLVSVLYTVVPPTMNPLIYTLRNKNTQTTLRKLLMSRHCPSN